ncbi:ABC transporter ATP-binding protein [Effusibacillus consociatus]|uniref:ABC transporter ATP-binding protein n=1 Tax=Effusibacillus consociatus TaxID=1117041 RepID=A0ABV9Q4J1_9BACL
MLSIRDLHVNYGQIAALKGVDLDVNEGEIVTIIGANGAGKSTLLKTLSGLLSPRLGDIVYEGSSITNMKPHHRVEKRLIHIPEGRAIIQRLTIEENLLMGAYHIKDRRQIEEGLVRSYELFPILAERRKLPAGTLSGGQQQMLAIARGMMANPKVLMLDEPSLGLAPIIIQEIFSIIRKLNEQGTTILLVEQNAKKALSIAHRGYVMETGHITIAGAGTELLNSPDVIAAYLGGHKAG